MATTDKTDSGAQAAGGSQFLTVAEVAALMRVNEYLDTSYFSAG